jgi:hypothetical protein
MFSKKTISIFFFLITLCLGAWAQNGTIRGTVFDAATGETLIGASVVKQGTTQGVSTDLDGKFSLNLEPGTHVIEVAFISYARQIVTGIEIEAGKIIVLDFRLASEYQSISEVVVTAKQVKNTENAMLSMQKKSTNMIDGISSQTFKKIGDSNAAGALRRVPGVSVEGGRHVYVRGLGDRYTKTILNGMVIPGLDPDRNSVQVDLFPTNTIDNIVVYKTFSPDLPGDFVGGIVDVVTKDFPEEKIFNVSYSMGYNPLMTFNKENIGQDGGRYDLLGFDDGGRRLKLDARSPIPDPSYNDPALTSLTSSFDGELAAKKKGNFFDQSLSLSGGNMYSGDKVSLGFNALLNYSLDYNFFEEAEFGIYRKYPESDELQLEKEANRKGALSEQDVLWNGLLIAGLKTKRSSFTLNLMRTQGGNVQTAKRVSREFDQNVATLVEDILQFTQREMNNVILGGRHRFDHWDISWKNAFTLSSIEDPDFKISSLSIDESSGDTLLRRGDGARLDRFYRNLYEMNNSSKIDFTRTLKLTNGRKSKIKIGAAYTFKERDYKIILSQFDYRIQSGGQSQSGDPDWFFETENLYNIQTGEGTYLLSTNLEPSNTFNARQTTASGYIMNELPLSSRLKAIYGLRAEQNEMYYTGQNQQGNLRYADSNTLSELNLLPSVNTVYSLNENMNLRASYNRTVARPSFREKSIAQIFDPISKITFIGNLDLQQTNIDNLDLRWEFFPSLGEVFSVSAFYKVFQGHIEMAIFETATDNVKPVNSGTSTVAGLEFEARKDLGFISDSTHQWSLGANVSIIQSRLDMSSINLPQNEQTELEVRQDNARNGEIVDRYRSMAGQSPYLINANLNYSDSKSGLEGNISYNVQGKSLSIVGIGLVPDVYTQPVHMVNARVGLKVGKERNGQLSLRVSNILSQNRVLKYESYGADSQIYSYYKDGQNFILGYSLTF